LKACSYNFPGLCCLPRGPYLYAFGFSLLIIETGVGNPLAFLRLSE